MRVGGRWRRTYRRPMAPSRKTQTACRRLHALVVAAAAACSLAFGAMHAQPAEAAHCAGASAMPNEAGAQALVQSTLCLLNNERRRRGISALRLNARLSRAAIAHSSDMVQ